MSNRGVFGRQSATDLSSCRAGQVVVRDAGRVLAVEKVARDYFMREVERELTGREEEQLIFKEY